MGQTVKLENWFSKNILSVFYFAFILIASLSCRSNMSCNFLCVIRIPNNYIFYSNINQNGSKFRNKLLNNVHAGLSF